MSMTDPIADLITRIRNAHTAKHRELKVPASRIKGAILEILRDEGFIEGYELDPSGPQGTLQVRLKYGRGGRAGIEGVSRVSRPGRRVYRGKSEIPMVLNGLGVCIVSTPRGVMTGASCQKQGLGGEVLCNVW